jgi:phosphoribosyl-dephospho-CoA transferase
MNPDVKNESTLKRYLLGQLDQEEQERLEREIMTDNDTFEQLSAAEDELVEEYLEDSLSARDREKFERHFLSTPERRQELTLAKALRRYVAEKKNASKVPFWESLLAPLRIQPALLKQALSAVLALAIIGGAWSARQAWRLHTELVQTLAQQTKFQDQAQDLQRQLAEQRTRNVQLAEELQHQEEQRSKMERGLKTPQQPSLVAFALVPGGVRDTGSLKRLGVPSSASLIKLELDLPSPGYPSYRVILQDADGEEITTQSRLEASKLGGRHVVVVTLPASLIPPDDYILKLSGRSTAGDFEDLGTYYFRVIKQ